MDRIMTAIDSVELRLPRGTSATSETVGKARIRLNPHFVPHRSDIVSTGPQGGGLPGQMSWDTILSLLSSIVSRMHRLGFTVGCVDIVRDDPKDRLILMEVRVESQINHSICDG